MRAFVKIIYIIALFFSGGGALCYSLVYISLDGIGSLGLVNNADNSYITTTKDSLYVYIDYTYYAGENIFHDNTVILSQKYDEYNPDTLIVKYNKYLPILNYIEQVPIERRSYKLGAITFTILFLFFFILWNFSDREKWFKRYESIGEKTRMYPYNKD